MQDDADRTKFVVGLGNPGRRYARTRHNLGFMVVEALCRRWQTGDGRRAFGGRFYDVRPERAESGRRRVMMLTPLTYMNCSGRAVRRMADFYKAQRRDILVVLDDMALEPGRLRARSQGSPGGHNGLADVLASLGGQDVPRLRIGIGTAPEMDATDFVLRLFETGESETISRAIEIAAEAVEDWVFDGIECVMEKYNKKGES